MTRRRRDDIVFSDSQVDRYGWRHQIRPWVQAGHRVIAPDMLGYGQTDKPLAAADYTLKKLADDLAALLDVTAVSKVVCIVRIRLPTMIDSDAPVITRLRSATIGALLSSVD